MTTQEKSLLDPSKPVTVTLWHYYSGHLKDNFDVLVATFNETVGMEQGIVVDAQSLGDVGQLANAVFDAASKSIGAQRMPDIFMAYSDNAHRVHQIVELVELENYFSDDELASFREEFLEEGRIGSDQRLRIVPIAKSSENLFVNKTDWDVFADKNGLTEENLATWEGLYETAKRYYETTGNGFFGIDANANFFLQAGMQLGQELYRYEGDQAQLQFSEETARKIWDYHYRPYIKGYYEKTGRFSSDDAKTGTVMAYVGSTAGAAYFPMEVTFSQQNIRTIEPLILPYPYFENGERYAVQQGAGMCITKSDTPHEYAAAVFLKWFTDPEQNVLFAVSTGYLPVKSEAIDEVVLMEVLETTEVINPAIRASLVTTTHMFDDYRFYNNRPFDGSFEMRELMESHLFNRIQRDLEVLEKRVTEGQDRETVVKTLVSDQQFEQWYHQFIQEAALIMNH
ncbi:extracellular solute-binding protein [Anoxynatronum buryatiense]|uniref:extracellular solute-binding protein n=1 Tax=Anoxynatronum buryatiense TaxID=489973 RepID=UPI0024B71FDF|nr:extracellular solute-binding protein [Anoxynatronum buryatiense]